MVGQSVAPCRPPPATSQPPPARPPPHPANTLPAPANCHAPVVVLLNDDPRGLLHGLSPHPTLQDKTQRAGGAGGRRAGAHTAHAGERPSAAPRLLSRQATPAALPGCRCLFSWLLSARPAQARVWGAQLRCSPQGMAAGAAWPPPAAPYRPWAASRPPLPPGSAAGSWAAQPCRTPSSLGAICRSCGAAWPPEASPDWNQRLPRLPGSPKPPT